MLINSINSLKITNNLNYTLNKTDKSTEKLSTGLRITSASDDAAGLSLGIKIKSRQLSLNVSSRNIQDGISLIQTAESALDEVHNMLNRVYELSIQSRNEIYTADQVAMFTQEARQIKTEIEALVDSATFNGVYLLQGDDLNIMTGSTKEDIMTFTLPSMTHLVRHLIVKDTPDRITDPENITTMINNVSAARASLGAIQNRLEHTLSSTKNQHENLLAAESNIMDVDMALEMAKKVKNDVLGQSMVSVLNKNISETSILKLF